MSSAINISKAYDLFHTLIHIPSLAFLIFIQPCPCTLYDGNQAFSCHLSQYLKSLE